MISQTEENIQQPDNFDTGPVSEIVHTNMNTQISQRIVIYTKDVELALGKSERSARHFLRLIKRALKKSDRQFVTMAEFCFFTGISEEEVRACIGR